MKRAADPSTRRCARALVGLLPLAVGWVACPFPEPPAATADAGLVNEGYVCELALCLTGATDQESPSNFPFGEMCDTEGIEGLLRECVDDETCWSTWKNITWIPGQAEDRGREVLDAVLEVLDDNGDGVYDAADPRCRVRIAGYSWGGVNAVALADVFRTSLDIGDARREVDLVVVVDAFQPFGASLDVPANVDRFVSFRHTVSPPSDCSRGAPFGPYSGQTPRCAGDTACWDYDYSQSGEVFPFLDGGAGRGVDLGHCTVADAAMIPVRALLLDEVDRPDDLVDVPLPPAGDVARWDDEGLD